MMVTASAVTLHATPPCGLPELHIASYGDIVKDNQAANLSYTACFEINTSSKGAMQYGAPSEYLQRLCLCFEELIWENSLTDLGI